MSKRRRLCVVTAVLAATPVLLAQAPLGTAFTYQGQFKEAGVPASGEYDFVFRLFDAPSGPAQVGSDRPVNAWTVSNGLFTVALDFGANAFNGQARWLEIAVGPPGGSLTTLSPRQPITAAPYAAQTRGMFVDSNLNVGIGTSTPGARLDVSAGNIHLDANHELHFADNGRITSHDEKHSILFRRDENKLELREYGDIIFSAGATAGDETDSVVVKSSGRVGIGTTTPEATLDLNGEMIHRGGAFKHLGHDLIIADPTRGDGGRALVHWGDGTNERLDINFGNDFNQGTMVHGNLGIGRAPSARLEVADGDIKVDMDRRLNFDAEDGRFFELGYDSATDSGIITAAGRNLELSSGWGEQLILRSGTGGMLFNQNDGVFDSTWMVLAGTGRLGIGSTAPEARLHVEAFGLEEPGIYARSYFGKAVDALTRATSTNEWTPAVYGRNEGAGDGVYGWSQSRHGTVGVTSSTNPDHAGVYGTNNGAGPAILADGDLEVKGDLVVSGAVRGDLGPNNGSPFPRPAYDSGWMEADPGDWWSIPHSVGGSVENYVVDLQCKDTSADNGFYLGIRSNDGLGLGAYWSLLTTDYIDVHVHSGEDDCGQVRVRIWVYN